MRNILHPIALARLVMDKSPHTLLVGEGANRFAEKQGVPTVPAYRLVTQASIDALEAFLNKTGKATSETGYVCYMVIEMKQIFKKQPKAKDEFYEFS